MDDAFPEMPCDENLKRLLEGLKNLHHPGFSLGAEQELLKIGKPAVKMLIEVIKDNDEPLLIRARVGEVLRKLGEPARKPLQALMDDLDNEDLETLKLAAKILMGIP